MGAEVEIIAYLISRYFGLRSFGEIYGLAFGAYVFAGAVGPLLMGIGFDLTCTYHGPPSIGYGCNRADNPDRTLQILSSMP
jgi:hypothetical protein